MEREVKAPVPARWIDLLNHDTAFLGNPRLSGARDPGQILDQMAAIGIALFAAMRTIPQEHYEAAAIDGASAWQRWIYITLPGVSYVVMIMVILHVLFTFNNFDFVYISTGGGPVNTTMVLPVYVYRLFWQNCQTGLAASVSAARHEWRRR
jgi:ABC-type sugar transport system permease subunit